VALQGRQLEYTQSDSGGDTYAERGVEGVRGQRHLDRVAAEGLALRLSASRAGSVRVRHLQQLDGPTYTAVGKRKK
jgi:hypothetical protein